MSAQHGTLRRGTVRAFRSRVARRCDVALVAPGDARWLVVHHAGMGVCGDAVQVAGFLCIGGAFRRAGFAGLNGFRVCAGNGKRFKKESRAKFEKNKGGRLHSSRCNLLVASSRWFLRK